MGFDAGILQDDHAPVWPYREEYKASREAVRKPADPAYWLEQSVVWYSQKLTQQMGMQRFQQYVDRLDYGNRDLSGDPGRSNGLTQSWLASSLQVSPREKVAFLRRLLDRSLPVSRSAQEKTIASMPAFSAADGWAIRGKTGVDSQPKVDGGGLDPDRLFGWFVGWAAKDGRTVVFARLVKDEHRMDTYPSYRARESLLGELPKLAGN